MRIPTEFVYNRLQVVFASAAILVLAVVAGMAGLHMDHMQEKVLDKYWSEVFSGHLGIAVILPVMIVGLSGGYLALLHPARSRWGIVGLVVMVAGVMGMVCITLINANIFWHFYGRLGHEM